MRHTKRMERSGPEFDDTPDQQARESPVTAEQWPDEDMSAASYGVLPQSLHPATLHQSCNFDSVCIYWTLDINFCLLKQ